MQQNVQKEEFYWYLRSNEEVIEETKSSLHGLTEQEAALRLEKEGLNKIAKEDTNKAAKILLRNFNTPLIYILSSTALISIFSNHFIEFSVITAIILLTGILGFVQEYRAERSIDALAKLTPKKVEVMRSGKKMELEAEKLVTGDVVILKRGMIIPADLRIIHSKGLMIDESILTGESMQKPKTSDRIDQQEVPLADRDNMAFSGTSVTQGSGLGIVVEKGLFSELGKISLRLKQIGDEKSPLQRQIGTMSKNISIFVIIICSFFFTILMMREIQMMDALILIGAVAVSGIPESFPLALTLSLSHGVKKMAKENALVKDLSSVETLGTTTVICTDKTGTLTQNKMVIERIFFSDKTEIIVEGKGYEPIGIFKSNNKIVTSKELKAHAPFFNTAILCNHAELNMENGEWKLLGEPTEGALLTLAKSAGFDEAVIREDNHEIYEIPFDPLHKYMVTVNSDVTQNNFQTAYLKGATEMVLKKCFYQRGLRGEIKPLTKREVNLIHQEVNKYSQESYRVLAIATKKFKTSFVHGKNPSSQQLKELEQGYVFEGIVDLKDPLREDIYASVKECEEAGIRVIMVTGDHKETARSIGTKLGLIKHSHDKIIEGHELNIMTDEELDAIISSVAIFARTTPEHKLRIVESLQRKGEIVAMTGDGVNDAPALKKADIGIAMGKSGTDVAREASNMILADDNFSTIVKAVKEGRTIYSNIRRFIFYLLTGNITEVSLMVIAVIAGLLTPLTALMVLFINLVTSTFPSIALSIEPTHPKVMKQKPRNPKERLLSSYILFKIFVLAPILFLGTFLLFLWKFQFQQASIDHARTVAFATVIMFELFHTFNARSLHTTIFNSSFFKNKILFLSIGISMTLTLIAIYTTLGQQIFHTVPLTLGEWGVIILVSSLVIGFSEVIKLLIKSEFKEQQNLKGVNINFE